MKTHPLHADPRAEKGPGATLAFRYYETDKWTSRSPLVIHLLLLTLCWQIRTSDYSVCKHHPFSRGGVSMATALPLCVWEHIREKSRGHTWPGRSHWNLIIKLVMSPEHDVSWFEENPDFTWQALLTCYVTPRQKRCPGNETWVPERSEGGFDWMRLQRGLCRDAACSIPFPPSSNLNSECLGGNSRPSCALTCGKLALRS